MKKIILFQIITLIFSLTVSDKVRKKENQITEQKLIEVFLEEQKIIQARYYYDLTQQETSQLLGKSQVQISRYEGKILQKLKTRL